MQTQMQGILRRKKDRHQSVKFSHNATALLILLTFVVAVALDTAGLVPVPVPKPALPVPVALAVPVELGYGGLVARLDLEDEVAVEDGLPVIELNPGLLG